MLCWLQRALLMALFGASGTAFGEHQVIRIWPGSAPGSETWTHREIEFYAKPLPSTPPMKMVRDVVTPTLTVYRPTAASATGTAILICPGGAFRLLDWVNEGTNAAEWLAASEAAQADVEAARKLSAANRKAVLSRKDRQAASVAA